MTAYSPLGSPDSASLMKRVNSPLLMEDPVVNRIATKLGKSPAQVINKETGLCCGMWPIWLEGVWRIVF